MPNYVSMYYKKILFQSIKNFMEYELYQNK